MSYGGSLMLRAALPSRIRPGLLAALLALGGCSGSQVVGQPGAAGKDTGNLTGLPYAISHKDARTDTKKASDGISGPGGEISGTICGSDVMMQATHNGDHIRVSGVIDNEWTAVMQIQEADGYLTLKGSMANYGYELRLFGDRLLGGVGRCKVDMRQDQADRDRFVQQWNAQGVPRTSSLQGIDALWSLPAAEQAVLLPLLVQCLFGQFFTNELKSSPEVRVGGPMGAVPRKTIAWSGSAMGSYCGG